MGAEWFGPAVTATIVASLITAVGWYASYSSTRHLEQARRLEKIRDFQIALRAEIRGERSHLLQADLEAHLREIERRYAEIDGYSVVVSRPVQPAIFEAIVPEIHVLPADVIDPVVLYQRQVQVISRFVDDMRADLFTRLPASRQIEMYRDYVGLLQFLAVLAERALSALDTSLSAPGTTAAGAAHPVSNPASVLSARQSASRSAWSRTSQHLSASYSRMRHRFQQPR